MYWFLSENLKDMSMKEFRGNDAVSGTRMWTSGHKFADPFPLEEFEVVTRTIGYGIPDGDRMPDMFDSSLPLMSTRLLAVLKECGADNLDTYPARVVDRDKGINYDNYRAVNVLGRVDALDRAKTKAEEDIEESSYPVYLSVAIDASRVQNLLCFRLHLGPRELVIHDDVAKKVAAAKLDGLLLIKTEDFDQNEF